jgi:hypothetical protein
MLNFPFKPEDPNEASISGLHLSSQKQTLRLQQNPPQIFLTLPDPGHDLMTSGTRESGADVASPTVDTPLYHDATDRGHP